jgi:NADPH:quinone reductase-like Zn-dependent oxidoreductase
MRLGCPVPDNQIDIGMRALHLPGAAEGDVPVFTYPDKKGKAEASRFSTDLPKPVIPAGCSMNAYIIRVETTALQKGELTWPEILARQRFHPWAGAISGHDVVGTIDIAHHATSAPSPKFKPGDRVWGLIDFDRDGAAADYVLAYENEIVLTPQSIDHPDRTSSANLATVPLSGLTAYQALYTNGHLPEPSTTTSTHHLNTPAPQSPKRLLITGASGTVGLLALQLAKLPSNPHPIHVTAISSPAHIPYLRDTLHADIILDYTTPNFHLSTALRDADVTEPFDLVIEARRGYHSAGRHCEGTWWACDER